MNKTVVSIGVGVVAAVLLIGARAAFVVANPCANPFIACVSFTEDARKTCTGTLYDYRTKILETAQNDRAYWEFENYCSRDLDIKISYLGSGILTSGSPSMVDASGEIELDRIKALSNGVAGFK